MDRTAREQIAKVLELAERRCGGLERLESLREMRERLLVLLRLDEFDKLLTVRGVEKTLLLLIVFRIGSDGSS